MREEPDTYGLRYTVKTAETNSCLLMLMVYDDEIAQLYSDKYNQANHVSYDVDEMNSIGADINKLRNMVYIIYQLRTLLKVSSD